MVEDNKRFPDPKTQSNATRVNDEVSPHQDGNNNNNEEEGERFPDPKTQSNATRVNEEVAPHQDNVEPPKPKSEPKTGGNPLSQKSTELPPSSDQPEEIERKTREQLAQKEDDRKKRAVEGGDKDTSHATIGKNEEKEAREQNKDKKADSKKSKSK